MAASLAQAIADVCERHLGALTVAGEADVRIDAEGTSYDKDLRCMHARTLDAEVRKRRGGEEARYSRAC
jgi:hypothetical protein